MKKILVLALALVMLLGVVSTANAEFAPIAKEDLKIGFVYIGDISDAGYTYAHHQGTLAMQEAIGLTDEQIILKRNVSDSSASDTETAIRELIDQGCNVIIGISFGYMDTMEEIAEEYPEIIFAHCSGYKSNDVNFSNYFGRIYEARYLSGIAAGLKTESDHLGYVAAFDTVPEVVYSLNAFYLGAKSVNPDVKMTVKAVGSWYDPTSERQVADALLDMGCDVLGMHCDTTGPVVAAQEKGKWAVGYNADMTEAGPDSFLTAPIWHWGVYLTEFVQGIIDGNYAPVNALPGMVEGLVDLAPLSANVAEGTAEAIEAAKATILSGEFGIFDGPIYDNQGNLQVAEGQTLTAEEILNITWFVDGITVE